MEDLFDMEYDLTEASGYIGRHDPTNARLIGELKQKCFMIMVEGLCGHNGYTYRYYRVFPTFIITSYIEHRVPPNYTIGGHNLGSYALRSLKHSKLCYHNDALISTVVSRFQRIQQLFDSELRSFKRDKIEFDLERELFDESKHNFAMEREAFEKEKHNLEMELAKYKGIVENCLKEISSYDF